MEQIINFKDLFVGQDYKVPILNNRYETYINLDNAATTPPFKRVMNKVNEFSPMYSSIHRGNGFKSLLTSDIYEEARNLALNLVNADSINNTAIFIKNSTEAINMLARLYKTEENDIIITSHMEHHSNDLPWRKKATVKYIETTPEGELNIDHFIQLINTFKGRIKLVSITGASNVTGYVNPIYKIARLTHEAGAKILVDASQLIPHSFIDIRDNNDMEHIDFLVYTSHKLYAPFGIGVLVGPRNFFNSIDPDNIGGGTVKIVTEDDIHWTETPEKNEAGTPNVMGAVALASSIKQIQELGYNRIEEHEQFITGYLLSGLKKINGLKIYGSPNADSSKRVGIVSFNLEQLPHALVSAILSFEYGIGVRNGCFCAHPYVLRLLNTKKEDVNRHMRNILEGDKTQIPGLVRVSIGMENTYKNIKKLLFALNNIARGEYSDSYYLDKKTGAYYPYGWDLRYQEYFNF
jgi:Selenocysteine lyase